MQFYVVDMSRFDDREFAYGEQVDQKTGDFDRCSVCGRAISMRKWLPPLKVKLSKPSFGDFVFGSFSGFLGSERFLGAFDASGLSGVASLTPVEVVRVGRSKLPVLTPSYYYVSIRSDGAIVDGVKSKIIREGGVLCQSCRTGGIIRSLEGVFLEEGSWKGDDIFRLVGLPGTVIVTQKFVDMVKQSALTNICFTPAEEYQLAWTKPFNI